MTTPRPFRHPTRANYKFRLSDRLVSVIEGAVAYTFPSDVIQKENFLAMDGEETLEKISQMTLESWNYRGHHPSQFRHYGPTARESFWRQGLGPGERNLGIGSAGPQ